LTATDFLFGHSTDVLVKGESSVRGEKFGTAFQYTTEKIGLTSRLGKLATLIPDKKYEAGIEYCQKYVQEYVHKAIAQQASGEKSEQDSPKYVFLDELAKTGTGAKKIQDELLNILVAGRDTTASLLAHLWYILARRPDIFNKLRAEVSQLGDKQPSFEEIKALKYLQWTLNETLRLHPIVSYFPSLALLLLPRVKTK
jgi:cytochrome P450